MVDQSPHNTAVTEVGDAIQHPRDRGAALGLPKRYEDLGLLGSGGFGEVRRVWDVQLKRAVAMKILHPELGGDEMRARFLAEIELSAKLSHPGIVAVHDAGELTDGRLWFTMAEIEGRTLRSVIDEAFSTANARVSLRRLLDLFARVCETVAYAHSRGVIHRDLKPENVMIGPFAQVLVMDWGIARKLGAPPENPTNALLLTDNENLTRAGDVLGTPAYMAPEQAFGEVARHGPATDVYALGAMLYHVLMGRPPPSVLKLHFATFTLSFDNATDIPSELISICQKAMARQLGDRYPDAGALSIEMGAFLDGARRRERALDALSAARILEESLQEKRNRAEVCREEALRALVGVRPFDPVDVKAMAWEREDQAAMLERDVALGEVLWIQAVQAALVIEPSLTEAHEALADHYRDKLVDADRARKAADVARFEVLLRAHDRGQHARFLRGDGALSLVTDPPGARVFAHRYEISKRRLLLTPFADLGCTPLRAITIPHGSYILVLSAEGRREVRYPVLIERGEHWDGIAPGENQAQSIALPREDEFDDNEALVPAGYAWTGGDPQAADPLRRQRIWVDAFRIRKFPVTCRDYLEFLNDTKVLSFLGSFDSILDHPAVRRTETGLWVLRDHDGSPFWHLDCPVIGDWMEASAFARWEATRTNVPYRLPNELEREKATRGVDGRLCPWGDHLDPAFACVLESHPSEPRRERVNGHPIDESPYGVRGLAGNSRDWCMNVWRTEGPRVENGRLVLESASLQDPDFRVIKGGAWGSTQHLSQAAGRFGSPPSARKNFVGFRLCASYEPS